MRPLDLVGARFGRLTVVSRATSDSDGQSRFICRCDCGETKTIRGQVLKRGGALSCGCLRASGVCRLRHGHARKGHRSAEYRIWTGMHSRCTNPKEKAYPDYGGRGITICDRWASFEAFLADMGPRPSPKHSIDRFPNNDGNYEPGNCRWATPKEQAWSLRKPRGAFIARVDDSEFTVTKDGVPA